MSSRAIVMRSSMSFVSPIWLTALIPWGTLAVWLLQGRRAPVSVPFLALWQSRVPVPRPRRKREVLPLAVVMALLAALLSLLAAAKPTISASSSREALHATLIVDRGLTMSAQTPAGPRYFAAAQALIDAIPPKQRSGHVELIALPGGDPVETTWDQCAKAVQSMPPTARDTHALVSESVSARLATASASPVFVITDQPLQGRERLVRISPEGTIQNVGITLLAARERPAPQVMVRVRNQSNLRTATLTVTFDGQSQRQTITLPNRPEEHDYFFNPPRLGSVIAAELNANDDLPANHRAWLVRTGAWPAIELRTAVSPELGRMIEAYQRSRPPSAESSRVLILSNPADLPADGAAILLQSMQEQSVSGRVQAAAHSITEHVSWEQMPMPVGVAGEPPAGWRTLVSVGGHPIVAVRPDGPRQVWVGLDAPAWAQTADYVVFWANVFDWVAGPGEQFAGYPLSAWTPEWKPSEPSRFEPGMWPGLYRRSDGAVRAFTAPDVILPPVQETNWREQVRKLSAAANRVDLSSSLLIGAAACLVIAAATWKRSKRASAIVPEARVSV